MAFVNSRSRSLDVLRGTAILLVLGRHVSYFQVWHKVGWAGVDLFFVLSGFLDLWLAVPRIHRDRRDRLSAVHHPARLQDLACALRLPRGDASVPGGAVRRSSVGIHRGAPFSGPQIISRWLERRRFRVQSYLVARGGRALLLAPASVAAGADSFRRIARAALHLLGSLSSPRAPASLFDESQPIWPSIRSSVTRRSSASMNFLAA